MPINKLEQVLNKFIALFLEALDSGFYQLYFKPTAHSQFVKVYKGKDVYLKPAPREQKKIEAVKEKLIILPTNELPSFVPLDTKTTPRPPDKNTIIHWLYKEPFVSTSTTKKGEVLLRTKYSEAKHITQELIEDALMRLKAIKNPQIVLAEERRKKTLLKKFDIHLRKIRKEFEELRKGCVIPLPEPFTFTYDEKLSGYIAIEVCTQMLVYIQVTEREFEKKPRGCSSLRDYLAKKLKQQKEEYLQEWGKEIEELSQLEAGKGEGGKTTETLKLRLIVNARDVYWEGKRIGTLSNIPFNILYALAMRPEQTLPYDLLQMFLSEASQENKAISKHKNTITARIPPLEPYIKTNGGLRLELSTEEIQVVGNIKYVDSQLVTYYAHKNKTEYEGLKKKYKKN